MAGAPVLEIRNLSVEYTIPRGNIRAVSGVDLTIRSGEVIGLAGESGCGKSTVAYSVMSLLRGTGQVTGGSIAFHGSNVVDLRGESLRQFRWNNVSMVPQSAMNNLNPVITIREQLCDAMLAHRSVGKAAAEAHARELLAMVQIEPSRLESFPHQLSGGMRQRVVIAMALALEPELIVMDEPTTGLDVVVQYAIMRSIVSLSESLGFAVLIISHDLPLLLEVCDRLAIMYAGKIVEIGSRTELLAAPVHPYTKGLLSSFPALIGPRVKLAGIPGSVPDLIDVLPGCLFRERCPHRMPVCDSEHPPRFTVGQDHEAACYLAHHSNWGGNNAQ
jgi:peptide/nickel transport system ATP-binding protein